MALFPQGFKGLGGALSEASPLLLSMANSLRQGQGTTGGLQQGLAGMMEQQRKRQAQELMQGIFGGGSGGVSMSTSGQPDLGGVGKPAATQNSVGWAPGTPDTLGLLREFEGFRETPYWDVNANRAGYGSDTVTMADGSVVPVNENTRVTREDAERDLSRRVSTEFEPIARQAAGENWGNLGEGQKAALTSIAYNYGRIPDSVTRALRSGGDVQGAIRGLSSHNEGVNAGRRNREADIYGGNVTMSAQNGQQGGQSPQAARLMQAMASGLLDPAQTQVVGMMLQQEMARSNPDPLQQLQIQREQLELERLRNPQQQAPAAIQELEYRARMGGLQPGTPEYQEFVRTGGQAQSQSLINAGNGNLYNPSTGEWVSAPQGPAEPLSTVGKLEADRAAGLIGDEAYQAALADLAPKGMVIESDGQGGFRMVQGSGSDAAISKPLTEGQGKDVVYSTRAKGAMEVLEPRANALASRTDIALGTVPMGFGRDFQNPEFQVAQQAGQEFLQAILRKDTGAAITQEEEATYGKTFLPQPGDGEEVLRSKAASRARAVAAIEGGMPPSAILAQERALASSGFAAPVVDAAPSVPAPPAPPAPPNGSVPQNMQGNPGTGAPMPPAAPGTVINGYRYKGGNINDRNSWEPVQ